MKFRKRRIRMKFKLNNVKIKSRLKIGQEIIHDKPNINVTQGEIKLHRLKGHVSLIWIEIIAQNEPEDMGVIRKELPYNT